MSGAALQARVEVLPAFTDDLDHLAALEREATLMLAAAFLRRTPPGEPNPADPGERFRECFPSLPAGVDRERVAPLLEAAAAVNRRREAAAEREGVLLAFTGLCRRWALTPFERSAVLLLLMQFTAPGFMDSFRRCGLERERPTPLGQDWNNSVEVGTILSIVCAGYREQLECRRHFSLDGTLVREGLVVFLDGVGEASNLLGSKVGLHERTVRTLLGDRNLYRTSLRFLRRERTAVSFEQVVLPDGLKEEVAACVGSFLEDRAAGRLDALDAFFGYGTGLAMLFHGPPGTGKTMLARALASRFGRQILSCTMESVGKFHSPEEILATVFREAETQGAIVLLDECDDLFVNNTRLSQALLTELEKSRCVVILATNKPVDLDPALERRIARKVAFPIPEAGERLRIWRSLLPEGIALAPDVDLAALAGRYRFSGGLIKNCLLLAATLAPRDGRGVTRVGRAQLERAAELQSPASTDEERICRRYAPEAGADELPVSAREREEIRGAARAWERLRAEGLGLNVLVSASDVAAGVRAAEALARECGLEVRSFNYGVIRSYTEINWVVDPVTQRKVPPLAFAFSGSLGAGALTLFVDRAAAFDGMLGRERGEERNHHLVELEEMLHAHAGLFCLVTWGLGPRPIPPEFHLHLALEHPPVDAQSGRWEEVLEEGTPEGGIAALVERWPMHAEEIDVVARQAKVLSAIRGVTGRPTLALVEEVIVRHRGARRAPLLFGEG